jgi:Lar family restriction alleviation protein
MTENQTIDLMRRLRATGGKGQGGQIKAEAADEIERLRAQIGTPATFCPDCGGPLWLLDGVPRCGQCYEPEKDNGVRSQTTALKPCPFCGSPKVSISRNTWGDGREGRYVECEECEASSGSWPVGEATVERASELAARKWNRRTEIVNG